MTSNTNNTSDMTSWRSAEYYGAVSTIDTKTNYPSGDGRQPEMKGSGSIPINLWRQSSAATMVTPGDHTNSKPAIAIDFYYPNYDRNCAPHGSIKPEYSDPAWPSNPTTFSPAVGGVNASGCIPYQHLNSCYAYALDRGNGQYTQLIPADCLPGFMGLPSLQGPEGLIILSQPRGPVPSNTGHITTPSAIGTGRPSSSSSDAVQSTIDSIVANLPQAPKKREKVYCDKWLHEGVCAFAQQGCRYKHEMPTDKATQHAVGLFNGLPKWYKEKYAVELRGRSPPLTSRTQSSPHGGRNALASGASWRGGQAARGGLLQVPSSSSPAPPRTACNSRSAGSPVAPHVWRGSGLYAGEANQRLGSGVISATSSNLYDLLFEQDEADIHDGEV